MTGIAIVLGYSYFVLEDFVRGPRIMLSSPENGTSTTTPVVAIVGRAVHVSNLTINDDTAPLDLDGNFYRRLILAPGYNIMKVTAMDRYKRTVEEVVEVTLLGKQLTIDTASRTIDMGASTETATTTGALTL